MKCKWCNKEIEHENLYAIISCITGYIFCNNKCQKDWQEYIDSQK